MKVKLVKPFHFHHYNGKNVYKKGMILKGVSHKKGLLVKHFYGYGQSLVINSSFFEIIK
jgi:hypothetical protein